MTMHYVKTQPLTDSQIAILTHSATTSYYGDELPYMVEAGLLEMTLYGKKDFEYGPFKGPGISRRFRPSARGLASLSLVPPERIEGLHQSRPIHTPDPKQEISCLALGLLLYSFDSETMRFSMTDTYPDAMYSAKYDLMQLGFLHDHVHNDLSYGSGIVEYTPEGATVIRSIQQAAARDFGPDLAEMSGALSMLFMAAGGIQLDANATFACTSEQWRVLEQYNFATVTTTGFDGSKSSQTLAVHVSQVITWFEGISKHYPYSVLGQFNLRLTELQALYPDVIAQFVSSKAKSLSR